MSHASPIRKLPDPGSHPRQRRMAKLRSNTLSEYDYARTLIKIIADDSFDKWDRNTCVQALSKMYRGLFLGIARKLYVETKEFDEDIWPECIARICRARNAEVYHPKNWLATIVRNAIFDYLKREHRLLRVELINSSEVSVGLKMILSKVLDRWPQKDRGNPTKSRAVAESWERLQMLEVDPQSYNLEMLFAEARTVFEPLLLAGIIELERLQQSCSDCFEIPCSQISINDSPDCEGTDQFTDIPSDVCDPCSGDPECIVNSRLEAEGYLQSLSTQDESVLRQRYYDEKTLQEVALRLNVTPERVRQIQNRALSKLRTQLAHPEEGEND